MTCTATWASGSKTSGTPITKAHPRMARLGSRSGWIPVRRVILVAALGITCRGCCAALWRDGRLGGPRTGANNLGFRVATSDLPELMERLRTFQNALGSPRDDGRSHRWRRFGAYGFSGSGKDRPPTTDGVMRQEFRSKLDAAGLDYIAEICTAGSYVPDAPRFGCRIERSPANPFADRRTPRWNAPTAFPHGHRGVRRVAVLSVSVEFFATGGDGDRGAIWESWPALKRTAAGRCSIHGSRATYCSPSPPCG